MPGAPAFEFTDRATPLVQMGRSVQRRLGNHRWGTTGRWGIARWGMQDWEPIWTDLTCEIHEITVDTGRGGASDRFRPGTADIVASNVHQISELIFPRVPETSQFFEYVEQPPIDHEEDLQAPDAATVTSTGWSFTDDFETRPPRWIFPPAYAADDGSFPTRPLLWGDGYVTPEIYGNDDGTTFEAHGVMQWTGRYPNGQIAECAVTIEDLEWAGEPSAGTPRCVIDLYAYGNTTDQAATCVRFTFVPVFAGNNELTVEMLELAADGSTVSDDILPTIDTGLGVDGVFPTVDLRVAFFGTYGDEIDIYFNGDVIVNAGWSEWASGDRIGFAVHYVEGTDVPGGQGPHITFFEGPDFTDDFARSPGSGWRVNPKYAAVYGPMIVEGGTMRPPVERFDTSSFNRGYRATGSAQWASDFAGDQVIETVLSSLSWPDGMSDSSLWFILSAKGNPRDLRSVVAEIVYEPGWSPSSTSFLFWELVQYGPSGERVHVPGVEGESSGYVDLGMTDGVFQEPAVWRLEADTLGEVRLYLAGELLGHAMFPNIPQGGRIGVFQEWGAGGGGEDARRGQVSRIDRISGGLREPLGTEELGMWVRIGVDHATSGNRWFFRGFVDALVPTYHPEHDDVVRIECVDSLGEAGRVYVDGGRLPRRFAEAPIRVWQILNAAHWPDRLRHIRDDSTQMSRPAAGKAVDLLTHVAESCGGAVYGDPITGEVVFRGQDWQGVQASLPPDAFITNFRPDDDDGFTRVCPTGWERSSRRSEMNTRVRLSTETSEEDGEPIVREWRTPDAERYYGVELYERTLLCIIPERLNELAIRQLRLRHPNRFPHVEAVLLDAATATEALDLMATATFTRPSVYQCQLIRDGEFVFNRKMLVTGVRHRMSPTRWTCRLTLDPASPFDESGGRWGRAHWGIDVWGATR